MMVISKHFRISLSATIILIAWTIAILTSFFSMVSLQNDVAIGAAKITASAQIDKDIQYWKWNVENGGIYAPVDQNTPNADLAHLNHRDVTTEDGRQLTLVAPGTMTRTVHQFEHNQSETKGYNSSFDALYDESERLEWKKKALQSFENGETIFTSFGKHEDMEYLRMVKPIFVENRCIQCHSEQNFQAGEIRGSMSVSIPMAPYQNLLSKKNKTMLFSHGGIWLAGLFALIWATFRFRVRQRIQEQQKQIITAQVEQFSTVMNSMDSIVYVSDMDTHELLFVNKKAEKLTGDWKGKKCWEAMQGLQTGPCHFCTNSKLIDSEGVPTKPYIWEFKNTKNGNWYQCRDVAIKWIDGRIVRLETATDINSLKQAEQELKNAKLVAEKAQEEKEAFYAIMSHELRTPLNPILGFADLLLASDVEEPEKSYLETIKRSAKHQLNLINNLLNFTKLKKENIEPNISQFNLVSLCKNALNDVERVAHGLELKFINGEQEQQVPIETRVNGDQDMMIQLIDNLLNNACKYTKEGQVSLHLHVNQRNGQKDLYCFEVRDTGVGIPKALQKHMFDPFTQVDKSFTREFGGVGLGLAICQEIISKLGGTIGVNSVEGEGSTFWFKIPLHTCNPCDKELNDDKMEQAKTHECNTHHYLIVEDRKDNVFILEKFIRSYGATCDVVSNGEEAICSCSKTTYNLILMDIALPKMDGYETSHLIRTKCPKNRNTPILAVTANVIPEMKYLCEKSGINDFLLKPIDRDQLIEIIRQLVRE